MPGEDARPLIPNHEQRQQAERAGHTSDRRRQGSLPVRVDTLVSRSAASRARPEGVANPDQPICDWCGQQPAEPLFINENLEERHLCESCKEDHKGPIKSLPGHRD